MKVKKLSAQLAMPAEDQDLQQRLDQLIPPPAGSGKKLLWGTSIVSLAIAVSVMNISGLIVPRPTSGGSFGSGYPLVVDRSEQRVTAKVTMPNYSSRSVRITDLALYAPGATLVDFGVIIEPAVEGVVQDDGSVVTEGLAEEFVPQTLLDLPVTVGPGDYAILVLSFQPEDCATVVDPIGEWGFAKVTMDFGDGAFLPFSRTVTINQDPIVENNEQLQFVRDEGEILNILADGTMTDVGVLTGACEYLQ